LAERTQARSFVSRNSQDQRARCAMHFGRMWALKSTQ
jgi:hypothetical protein